MSKTHRVFSVLILLALLIMTATPAYAFDGRSGDKVVIQAGDVVNDDLYIGANEFVLDGTVNGDVVVGGKMITINGTINGNLMAVGQTIVINGTVTGASRIAGSVLFIGEKANIGKDVVGAGYSLESRKGSAIGRDVVFAGGQILLAGNVMRNVQAATGGLEVAGNVGGNVKADVGDNQSRSGPPPSAFMGQSTVPVPSVNDGLTIDPSAKISGNLEYTQTKDLTFPAGSHQRKDFTHRAISQERSSNVRNARPKSSELVVEFTSLARDFDFDRPAVALAFPNPDQKADGKIGNEAVAKLGLGRDRLCGVLLLHSVNCVRHDPRWNCIRCVDAWRFERNHGLAWHPGAPGTHRRVRVGHFVHRKSGLRHGTWQMDFNQVQIAAGRTPILADADWGVRHRDRGCPVVVSAHPRYPRRTAELRNRIVRSRCSLVVGTRDAGEKAACFINLNQ